MKKFYQTPHQKYLLAKINKHRNHVLDLMRYERETDGLPDTKIVNGEKKHRWIWEYNDNQRLYKLSRRLQKMNSMSCKIYANSYIVEAQVDLHCF